MVLQKEFLAKILSHQLTQKGFSVPFCTKGPKALELIDDATIDLVILESEISDPDGFDVLQNIRQRFSSGDLPVIVVTEPNRSQQISRALQLGANDFLTTPIDLNIALARIQIQLDLMRASRALRESQERYALALEGTSDGIWDWDLRSDRIFFSARWKAMLGFRDDEIGEDPDDWFERIHLDDRARVRNAVHEYLAGKVSQFGVEYRIQHRDLGFRWCMARGIARFDEAGRPYRLAGSQTDMTYRGVHDNLTGLPAREVFLERVANALSRPRDANRPYLAVHYLNINNFKFINTNFGNHVGDQALLVFCDFLRECLSPKDMLARLDGPNFVVLQDDLAAADEAISLTCRILDRTQSAVDLDGHRMMLRVFSGIALAEPPLPRPEDIVQHANAALIRASESGQPTFEVYRKDMGAEMVRRMQLEIDLHHAVTNGEISLVFQPIIDLTRRCIVGVETLARWAHPKFGAVSPTHFIPLAEASGEINALGAWVMEEAFRKYPILKHDGSPDFHMAVNLSGKQLGDANLLPMISELLDRAKVPPNSLSLELTESILVQNRSLNRDVLDALHRMGISISIDDFGTGYSSLSYLAHFPIDILKIDRSFVQGLTQNPHHVAITKAIISMGHSLGHKIIAEGVETDAQLQVVVDLGCDLVQGFLFSEALPAENFPQLHQQMGEWKTPKTDSNPG